MSRALLARQTGDASEQRHIGFQREAEFLLQRRLGEGFEAVLRDPWLNTDGANRCFAWYSILRNPRRSKSQTTMPAVCATSRPIRIPASGVVISRGIAWADGGNHIAIHDARLQAVHRRRRIRRLWDWEIIERQDWPVHIANRRKYSLIRQIMDGEAGPRTCSPTLPATSHAGAAAALGPSANRSGGPPPAAREQITGQMQPPPWKKK